MPGCTAPSAQRWRRGGPPWPNERVVQLSKNGPRAAVGELPSVALLDINLGNELVTLVAETLRALAVPFAVASAYDRPEQFGGEVLAGAPNAGKPIGERRLLAALEQLMAS